MFYFGMGGGENMIDQSESTLNLLRAPLWEDQHYQFGLGIMF